MTRYAVAKVEDVPVTARVTWARNEHGTIHEMAEKLNSGALDPTALSWIRRPIGRNLHDIRGALCVVDTAA